MADATKTPVPTPAKAPAPVAKAVAAPAKPAAPQPVTPKPVAKKPVPVVARVVAKPAPVTPPPAAPMAVPAASKESQMDIKNTAETVATKAQALFADANDRTKGAVDKSQKLFAEMNDFSKGNIEAIVESSKIALKGVEAMGQDAAAYAKTSFEDATAAAKTLAGVKSPTEFVRLQSDYMRTAFDRFVAHSSRSTETMLKLAGEVAQPISNRVSLAAEKVKIAA